METPARCSHCNQETYLFVGDVALCLKCDEARERAAGRLRYERLDSSRKLASIEKPTIVRTAQAS